MSQYRFARGFAIGATGFVSGYYASSGMKKNKFTIHAVLPEGSPQPSRVLSISKEKEPLTVMEYPLSGDTSVEREFDKFVSVYDRSLKIPTYVLEVLTKHRNIAGENYKHPKREYKEDMQIHPIFRSTEKDYKDHHNKSGKVRTTKGHLACESNYPKDEKARKETSIFSILAPQDTLGPYCKIACRKDLNFINQQKEKKGTEFVILELWKNSKCNSGVWKALEDHVRNLLPDYDYVTVCSGTLNVPREVDFDKWNEEDKKKFGKFLYEEEYDMVKNDLNGKREFMVYQMTGNVAVPTHFFKVLICEKENSAPHIEAYEVKNAPASYKSFKTKDFTVPIGRIERLSGYSFTEGYIRDRAEEMKENLKNLTRLESFGTENVGLSRDL